MVYLLANFVCSPEFAGSELVQNKTRTDKMYPMTVFGCLFLQDLSDLGMPNQIRGTN